MKYLKLFEDYQNFTNYKGEKALSLFLNEVDILPATNLSNKDKSNIINIFFVRKVLAIPSTIVWNVNNRKRIINNKLLFNSVNDYINGKFELEIDNDVNKLNGLFFNDLQRHLQRRIEVTEIYFNVINNNDTIDANFENLLLKYLSN